MDELHATCKSLTGLKSSTDYLKAADKPPGVIACAERQPQGTRPQARWQGVTHPEATVTLGVVVAHPRENKPAAYCRLWLHVDRQGPKKELI